MNNFRFCETISFKLATKDELRKYYQEHVTNNKYFDLKKILAIFFLFPYGPCKSEINHDILEMVAIKCQFEVVCYEIVSNMDCRQIKNDNRCLCTGAEMWYCCLKYHDKNH